MVKLLPPALTGILLMGSLVGWLAPTTGKAEFPANGSRLFADNGRNASTQLAREKLSETETIVFRLVEAHLPELTAVLNQLRSVQPREYELAIKDLAKAARRLDAAQARDQRLFEIEVELLQAQHQTSLLVAKLKVRDSQADRRKLREAAQRLQQAQVARAEYDVATFRQRVARAQQQLDSAINRLETRKSEADQQVEKSYLNLLRKAGRDSERKEAGDATSTIPPESSSKAAKKPGNNASRSSSSRKPSSPQ